MPLHTNLKHTKNLHKNHPHVRHFHYLRLLWLLLLIGGLALIHVIATVQSRSAVQNNVLAYATSMSVGDLLAGTNHARAVNGAGELLLHPQLTSGAQAKAEHMVIHNYWSHIAPDGTQPWTFFTNAGYQYQTAGENLAYGFATSSQTIDGWMNSPGHRANMLGAYTHVGFGIANGASYQGGEYTVVVAFYATPAHVAAAPTPPPAPPAPEPQPVPAPEPQPEPTPPAGSDQPEPTAPTPEPEPETEATTHTPEPISTAQTEPQRVTQLQSLLTGQSDWPALASLGVISATSIGFMSTHIQLMRRGWRHSMRFIYMHPALDIAVLAALLAAMLTSATGFIL